MFSGQLLLWHGVCNFDSIGILSFVFDFVVVWPWRPLVLRGVSGIQIVLWGHTAGTRGGSSWMLLVTCETPLGTPDGT